MSESTDSVQDVADTAFWIAAYRALESKRTDALFQDPLAEKLALKKGTAILREMGDSSIMAWTVSVRTHVIDELLWHAVARGVDTVLNLGCGLDTRPYRLKFIKEVNWIEADFPAMIEFKENQLLQDKPLCNLTRVKIDLSEREKRNFLLQSVSAQSKSILVLTEGVTCYLKTNQVAELAADLSAHESFEFWINDYFSKEFMKLYKEGRFLKKLRDKAPFQFFPEDWLEFFGAHGWRLNEMKYLTEEGEKLGRPTPYPLIGKILIPLLSKSRKELIRRMTGYALLEPTKRSTL